MDTRPMTANQKRRTRERARRVKRHEQRRQHAARRQDDRRSRRAGRMTRNERHALFGVLLVITFLIALLPRAAAPQVPAWWYAGWLPATDSECRVWEREALTNDGHGQVWSNRILRDWMSEQRSMRSVVAALVEGEL